jgi:hypothetical protein
MAAVSFTAMIACRAQQPAPATAAAAVQLTPYTAPDQSAGVGLPTGWKATSGTQTEIHATGPAGEAVALGTTVVARNGPLQLSKNAPGVGVALSMPYATPLPQKLMAIFAQNAMGAGTPDPKLTITSGTPIPVPSTVGQCARMVGNFTAPAGPMDLLAVVCSLPPDTGGTYKNIMLLAQAPAATAAQSAPEAQAIFRSYTIPPTWLQRKLAPFTAPPPPPAAKGGGGGGMGLGTIAGQVGVDNSVNCFDLSVLRGLSGNQLPKSCGGTGPG